MLAADPVRHSTGAAGCGSARSEPSPWRTNSTASSPALYQANPRTPSQCPPPLACHGFGAASRRLRGARSEECANAQRAPTPQSSIRPAAAAAASRASACVRCAAARLRRCARPAASSVGCENYSWQNAAAAARGRLAALLARHVMPRHAVLGRAAGGLLGLRRRLGQRDAAGGRRRRRRPRQPAGTHTWQRELLLQGSAGTTKDQSRVSLQRDQARWRRRRLRQPAETVRVGALSSTTDTQAGSGHREASLQPASPCVTCATVPRDCQVSPSEAGHPMYAKVHTHRGTDPRHLATLCSNAPLCNVLEQLGHIRGGLGGGLPVH